MYYLHNKTIYYLHNKPVTPLYYNQADQITLHIYS